MGINYQMYDPPAEVVHSKDLHGLLGHVGLDHAIFSHIITVIVATINLIWTFATYGWRATTRTLQHAHDTISHLIDGTHDPKKILFDDQLNYFHGETHHAIGLVHATIAAIKTAIPIEL